MTVILQNDHVQVCSLDLKPRFLVNDVNPIVQTELDGLKFEFGAHKYCIVFLVWQTSVNINTSHLYLTITSVSLYSSEIS